LAEVCEIPFEKLSLSHTFVQNGFDSLHAVKLQLRIEVVAEIEIPELLEDILVMRLDGLCEKYASLSSGRGVPMLKYQVLEQVNGTGVQRRDPETDTST